MKSGISKLNHPANWLLLLLFSFGCGSQLKLNSAWHEPGATANANQEVQGKNLTYVEKENVSLAFSNDQDFLYITMVTTDRSIMRQFMTLGFTVWFDPDGGTDKTLGIRFPIGMRERGFTMRGREENGDQAAMRANFEQSLTEFEIIRSGQKEPERMYTKAAAGLKLKADVLENKLVYELQVPLKKLPDYPVAIAAKPNHSIGVGFETAKFERPEFRNRGFGGEPRAPGGFGGFGGGRGRGHMGGHGFETPKQLKLWVAVKLQTSAESAQAVVK